MDKNAIKTFAINSRRKLMEDVTFQMNLLGISDKGIAEPSSSAEGMETYELAGSSHTIYDNQIKQRESLVREVKNKGFENVVEEVAYTWFNRIIAIRFMEVNNYLPTRTRVLSSEIEGKIEPDIITEALDLDLDYSDEDRNKIFSLKESNKQDDLFQFLFIKQCNKLNDILPGLFEKTEDYMELLLNINFTDSEGVVRQLVENIQEEDFSNQVEIIGWLYQYYNTELKDEINNKNEKITKETLPPVTQLFTPTWIVKYMVENSLGRLWLYGHNTENLKSKWAYFLNDATQIIEIQNNFNNIKKHYQNIKPQDIKIIDPCMGSGQILLYTFDILVQIYSSVGFSQQDAVISILENNIYGLDIDNRAYQLTYFSLMMKARQYNRNIFREIICPNVLPIQETNNLNKKLFDSLISKNKKIKEDLEYLYQTFLDAKEFGSLINIKNINLNEIYEFLLNLEIEDKLFYYIFKEDLEILKNVILQANYLKQRYDIVITNPPYLGSGKMEEKLKNFLNKNYPISSYDFSAAFIEKCGQMVISNGFLSMITQQSFMKSSTSYDLRLEFLEKTLINMAHLGTDAFEDIKGDYVRVTSFVQLNNMIENFKSLFINLENYDNKTKEKEFFKKSNYYKIISSDFENIPGNPIVSNVSEKVFDCFKNYKFLEDISILKSGSSSGNNSKFFKFWFEVDLNKVDFNAENFGSVKQKFVPLNKGGSFRRWYGNKEYISVKQFAENDDMIFKESITWSDIKSKYFNARLHENGIISNNVGKRAFFNDNDTLLYMLGLLNSSVIQYILDLIIPGTHFDIGYVGKIPIIFGNEEKVKEIVLENISITKEDWDDNELSWDFKVHPILSNNNGKLKDNYDFYKESKNSSINQLINNEKIINEIFIEMYNLDEVVSADVDKSKFYIRKADLAKVIKSFISYAVGCMFGRYSLDKEGLIFAGGNFNLDDYSKFVPDYDNIIPMLDAGYFADDILGLFVEFVKICFGEENLEENLDFIAGALKNKGNGNREIIRNYFLNDFFKDHVKTYKKCPIYWQFDSGKENGFKCLIYMHRYDKDLVARVRTDYLFKTQKAIEDKISYCDNIINNSTNTTEKSQAKKDKNKLVKQLAETREYDEVLAHIANEQIEINLDDGVKVNYAKFQDIEVSKDGGKTKKVNLLKKI